MNSISKLLAVIDAYQSARALSVSRTSFLVFGDGKVIGGLKSGTRDITTGRLESAIAWLSENWPENAEWPESVERPESSNLLPAATEPSPSTTEAAQ